jgi:hypothetical protein
MSYPDILFVVRDGEDNEALRYSLRSLSNIKHGKIFIVGYTPSWVSGLISIPVNQSNASDLENSNANLLVGLINPGLSNDFILMMDDIFIMRPLQVGYYAHGLLSDRIAQYKRWNKFEQAYSLITTQNWLMSHNMSSQLNCELHFPFSFNRQKLAIMFKLWGDKPLAQLRPRTAYGNMWLSQLRIEEANDAKDSTNAKDNFISAGRDFGTSDIGGLIKSIFTNPSPYESTTRSTTI